MSADNVVVTEIVVDAADAEKNAKSYANAMDQAKSSTDDMVNSAKATSLALAGVGVAVIGMIVGVNSYVDRVLSLNKGLTDLQTQAKMAGLSLADLQGLKLGADINGLAVSDFNSGLQQSAKLLNDASRNSNTLSKELAENGISVRQSNGAMITQNQLLGIAADLIKRARNPGDQSAIAEMLGFTRAWIPLLEQGSEAMAGLTSEAERAGAVISDETINRAAEFDRQWRKSSVEFSAYMKSAMLELLPYVDDLIDRASKFVKSIDKDAIEKASLAQLKAGADALGIPDEAAVKFDLTGVAENWEKFGDEVKGVFQSFIDFDKAGPFSNIITLFGLINSTPPSFGDVKSKISGLLPAVSAVPQQDVKWYGGTSPVMDTSSEAIQAGKNAAAWIAASVAYRQYAAAVMSGADNISGGFSKVAANSNESKDAYDRAEEALRKYIETTKAAATSIDMTTGAQERLRAIAQLTAAGMKDGLTREAAAARAEMSGLADDAGKAAAELAKARVDSKIKFDRDTFGLSAEDVAIARELKGLYADIPTSMNSSEAAQMRLNAQMKAGQEIVSGFANDLVSGLLRGESAMKSMTTAATNLVSKLASSNLTRFMQGGSIFGNQELNSTQGAVGMASAGLAGYQSGNPLTGALGGAMAGATFGPIGAVAGGILGAVGGILGASEKSKKQLEEAQHVWAAAGPAFDKFITEMTGETKGPISTPFRQAANENEERQDDSDQHRRAA